MDLLTEHKVRGIVGEERVAELRSALHTARELLCAETYGHSVPSTASSGDLDRAEPHLTPLSPEETSPVPPTKPAVESRAMSQEDEDVLRRCSALLRAHVHGSLTGPDLMALRDGLAASLAAVESQLDPSGAGSGGSLRPGAVAPRTSVEQGTSQASSPAEDEASSTIGGLQSVGGVLSEMGVGDRPPEFQPEMSEEPTNTKQGWTSGSLSGSDQAVATKALGYLLKHRGGKGYGRGRVNGAEAESMVSTLAELTEILHEEVVEA